MVSKYGNTNVNAERSQFNESAIIDINSIDVTARSLNGENITLTYFDTGTNLFSTQSFVCTGAFWTAYAGGVTYVWFTGRASSSIGDLIFSNYYIGANDSGSTVLMTESSGGNYVAKEIIKGSNAGDIEVNHVRFIDPTLGSNSIYASYSKFNGGSQVGTTQQVNINALATEMNNAISFVNADGTHLLQPYLYTEVVISSANILAMGSSPIQLLPAGGVGTYYDVDRVIIEYTFGTTDYELTNDAPFIGFSDYSGAQLVRYFLTENLTESKILIWRGGTGAIEDVTIDAAADTYQASYGISTNKALVLSTFNGTNPVNGDGTALAKIYYKLKSFGSEL